MGNLLLRHQERKLPDLQPHLGRDLRPRHLPPRLPFTERSPRRGEPRGVLRRGSRPPDGSRAARAVPGKTSGDVPAGATDSCARPAGVPVVGGPEPAGSGPQARGISAHPGRKLRTRPRDADRPGSVGAFGRRAPMRRYLLGRLLRILPVVFGVVTVVFLLIHLLPGDPLSLIHISEPTRLGMISYAVF